MPYNLVLAKNSHPRVPIVHWSGGGQRKQCDPIGRDSCESAPPSRRRARCPGQDLGCTCRLPHRAQSSSQQPSGTATMVPVVCCIVDQLLGCLFSFRPTHPSSRRGQNVSELGALNSQCFSCTLALNLCAYRASYGYRSEMTYSDERDFCYTMDRIPSPTSEMFFAQWFANTQILCTPLIWSYRCALRIEL